MNLKRCAKSKCHAARFFVTDYMQSVFNLFTHGERLPGSQAICGSPCKAMRAREYLPIIGNLNEENTQEVQGSLTWRITHEVMRQAFKAVKKNRGAAGLDKVSIKMFESNPEQNWLSGISLGRFLLKESTCYPYF